VAAGAMLGSISGAVIHRSNLPVLIVPPPHATTSPDLSKWQ
jgi:nucleotide-binding universal stress UspA family protein